MTNANFRNVYIKYVLFFLKKNQETQNCFSNSHLNYSFLSFLNFPKYKQRTNLFGLGRVEHTFNPSTQKVETSGAL